jgi:hypothetical protein
MRIILTQERLKMLWWFTGLIAFGLLLVTLALFVRAGRIQDNGILAYVTGSQVAPFLREQPGNSSAVITVLEFGTPVRVKDSVSRSNQDWYYVDTGQMTGWVLASLVSFEPPDEAGQP